MGRKRGSSRREKELVLTTQPLVLNKRMKNDSQANLTEGRALEVASETGCRQDQCREGAGGEVGEKKANQRFPRKLTGVRFGRLLVVEFAGIRNTNSHWMCVCDCGTRKVTSRCTLVQGRTKSCGCLVRDFPINTTHGHAASKANGGSSAEYRIWTNIKTRCYNKNAINYARYGGRGIAMCDRWRNSFENFFADMGRRPSKLHSIERKENLVGYSPDNCKWVTSLEQANNKRSNVFLTLNGVTMTISQWAVKIGIKPAVITKRRTRGWSDEKALSTPIVNSSKFRSP